MKQILRAFVITFLPIALATLLASCNKPDQPKAAAPTELNMLVWSEYIPQEIVDNFQDETHIKVHLDTVSSNEAMQAKLTSGATKYDLIQPSEYFVEALIK